jgi:hypothetical protein
MRKPASKEFDPQAFLAKVGAGNNGLRFSRSQLQPQCISSTSGLSGFRPANFDGNYRGGSRTRGGTMFWDAENVGDDGPNF